MPTVVPPGICWPHITAPVGGTTCVIDTPDGMCRKDSLIFAVKRGIDSRSLRMDQVDAPQGILLSMMVTPSAFAFFNRIHDLSLLFRRSFAEDGAANSDLIAAASDSTFEVLAHTHTQLQGVRIEL